MGRPMTAYQVDGFDADNARLFSLTIKAASPDIAKLLASAELRKSPDGTAIMLRRAEVEVRKLR